MLKAAGIFAGLHILAESLKTYESQFQEQLRRYEASGSSAVV